MLTSCTGDSAGVPSHRRDLTLRLHDASVERTYAAVGLGFFGHQKNCN